MFAFILHDADKGETYVGRDPIGVRPIFYGQDSKGNFAFASEAKAIINICDGHTIKPFLPGHHWNSKTEQFTKWYKPRYNLEDTDLKTYDENKALRKTAELLY